MCPSTVPCRRLLFLLSISTAAAQSSEIGPSRPSVGIVIGIFMVMLTLTVLFLVYSRLCHAIATELFSPVVSASRPEDGLLPLHASRVHRNLIESLPVFRFASLKGAREGLECAVCLAAFEDADILRLLPKCKHAFHVDCVDRWLEGNTSCPLCRHRVDADESAEDADMDQLQMLVEREPVARHSSSRSITGGNNDIESVLLASEPVELTHKFKHRIIASDVVFKTRWSDVNSSDLMSLSSDMLSVMSSKRFDPESSDFSRNSTERRVDEKALMLGRKRCMSEIFDVPRFGIESSGADERVRKVWLPIVRRTVQWFGGRDKIGPQSDQNSGKDADVFGRL